MCPWSLNSVANSVASIVCSSEGKYFRAFLTERVNSSGDKLGFRTGACGMDWSLWWGGGCGERGIPEQIVRRLAFICSMLIENYNS